MISGWFTELTVSKQTMAIIGNMMKFRHFRNIMHYRARVLVQFTIYRNLYDNKGPGSYSWLKTGKAVAVFYNNYSGPIIKAVGSFAVTL